MRLSHCTEFGRPEAIVTGLPIRTRCKNSLKEISEQ